MTPETLDFGGITLGHKFEDIELPKRANCLDRLPGDVSVQEYDMVVGEVVDENGQAPV